ncbi:iron-containing alcohol dehydrogenase [Salibacterium salarium]|uniref:Iron-containing alcohol dehydrogenase n=1 Tax=Salibacterium salarium TaxID=284579 RepID=A0A428N0Q2_9BACI|nr:iron-containing alcohol dehydrogenase [Salibacterium salarium]RSL31936.1 iron-containing alcohol dehydrogenase [Salibacterium salarium]
MSDNKIFTFSSPTTVEFGNGSIKNLGDHVKQLGGTNALVVTDPGVEKAGITQKLLNVLQNSSIPHSVYNDIEPDPDIEGVNLGQKLAEDSGCDCVIGIGGGSSMDIAKAIGLMLGNEGSIRDYVGIGVVPNKGAPVIAVPTTAGTGSEITMFSVMSDKKANTKLSVGSTFNCPDLALGDPELTITLPPHVTAATGMDALTHALESYVNKSTQPISESLAMRAMKLISENLRTAVTQPENIDARYNLLLASSMAAMAFNSTRLGLSHALAIPLGAHFNIPHGTVNAVLLSEVMNYNFIGNLEKYKYIAEIFGMPTENMSLREAAEQSVIAVRQLKNDVGIHNKLSDYGVKEKDLNFIADEAMLSGNVPVNPRKPTSNDLKEISKTVL